MDGMERFKMAQLFRKSAIEKLSSPEQLDKSIVVTSPLSWLSLIGVALIVVCFVIWSICGTMPTTTEAQGIISNGIYTNSIYAEFGGKISEVYVTEGAKVEKNKVLCSVIDGNNIAHDITAKEDCVITKQLVQKDDIVNYSDEMFGISPVSSNDFYVIFYVGIEQLPSMHTGMDVVVNMPGYDNQKYGHMKGKIVHVDDFAADETSIRRVLGNNEDVISYLGAMEQPVVPVTCKLEKDKTSSNGLFWSSEMGKELHANVGSVVKVKIIMNESAPITKLIPAFEN
jgi:multidrug resistance efflux pump